MRGSSGSVLVGIDLGTSRCRACAIDAAGVQLAFSATSMPSPEHRNGRIEQSPDVWWQATVSALDGLLGRIDRSRMRAIAVAGTSGTVLVADAAGRPLANALMYNDQSSVA